MTRYWTVNGRFLTQRMTGVQRYGRETVLALDRLIHEGHPLARDLAVEILVPAGAAPLPDLRAISVREAQGLSGHLWEQIVLPLWSRGRILSLCNTSTVIGRRQIVCIHDLNVFLFPQSYSRGFRLLYRLLLPLLGRVSRTIATVSHFSAEQIARARITGPDKIVIAPNGHEHALRWGPGAPVTAEGDRDTVVVLGSLAPHKNIATLLKIAPDLAASGLRLAIVGNKEAHVYGDAGLERNAAGAVWMGSLSDQELSALLARSLCLAFPSLTEGFGLPPLEAMAIGCPVVVSDRASLPEVCADAALYAPALSPDRWYEAIMRLHRNPALRAEMVERGRLRATHFSWQRSAEIYLDAMAQADGIVPVRRPAEERADARAELAPG